MTVQRRIPRDLGWVLLAALIARALGLLLLFVLPGNGPLEMGGGDQTGYASLAGYLHRTGRFDDTLFLARAPGYPALVALLYAILGANPWWMVLVNAALGVALAAITWALARDLSGNARLALVAGLWAALDPAGVVHSLNPLAEALANAGLGLALLLAWRLHQRPQVLTAIFAGLSLAAATFARPTTLLFWLALVAWLLLANARQWRRLLPYALLLAAACGLPLLGWIVHNGQAFGIAEFNTSGTWSLLFVRGASVLHQATGQDAADIQCQLVIDLAARQGRELDPATVTPESIWESFIVSSAAEQAVMRQMAAEIIAAHPLHYLLTYAIGFGRMFATTEELHALWPLEIAYHLVFYGLALLGLIPLWRQNRAALALLLLTGLYITGITLFTVTINDTRMRSPLIPVLCILAAYGLRGYRTSEGVRRGVQLNAPASQCTQSYRP